jgi:hypothetical protein
MEPQTKLKNIGIVISVVAILALIASIVFSQKNNDTALLPSTNTTSDTSTVPPNTTTNQQVATIPSDTTKKSVYKDGTYTATGSYMSPGGLDHVGVTLTLKNDVVTGATVTNGAGDNTSKRYETMFISGYKQYVVGKNISAVAVTKVSGSSLTSKGFNNALAQIETQAKA